MKPQGQSRTGERHLALFIKSARGPSKESEGKKSREWAGIPVETLTPADRSMSNDWELQKGDFGCRCLGSISNE